MTLHTPDHPSSHFASSSSRTPTRIAAHDIESGSRRGVSLDADDSSESELELRSSTDGGGSSSSASVDDDDLGGDKMLGSAAGAVNGVVSPGTERRMHEANGLPASKNTGKDKETLNEGSAGTEEGCNEASSSSSRPRRTASSKAHLAWEGRAPDRAPRLLVEVEPRKRAGTSMSAGPKRKVGRPRKNADASADASVGERAGKVSVPKTGGAAYERDDSEESELASRNSDAERNFDASSHTLDKGKGRTGAVVQIDVTPRKSRRPSSTASVSRSVASPFADEEEAPPVVVPRKRGRPPKNAKVNASSSTSQSSTPRRRASSSVSGSASKRKRITPSHSSVSRARPTPSTPSGLTGRSEKHDGRKGESQDDASASASLVVPTSSDAYFAAHASTRSRKAKDQTSSALLSARLGPLRLSSLADLSQVSTTHTDLSTLQRSHNSWRYMLQDGFPILFHGVGEMKQVLDSFASRMAEEGYANSVIVRGDHVKRPEEILDAVELALGMDKTGRRREEDDVFATPIERRAALVSKHLRRGRRRAKDGDPLQEDEDDDDHDCWLDDWQDVEPIPEAVDDLECPPLLLLIHNVSSAPLLVARAQRALGILCRSKLIWLMGSTAHVRAASLLNLHPSSPRWVLHALHTFIAREPSARVAHSAGLPRALYGSASSNSAQRAVGSAAPSASLGITSGTAHASEVQSDLSAKQALHIFKSVTNNAQSLFLKLANLQLQKLRSDTPAAAPGSTTYSELGTLAARNFIATNPGSLALVVHEFTSHGLLRAVGSDTQMDNTGSQSQSGVAATQVVQGISTFASATTLRLALDKEELERAVQLCTAARAHR
ncbi:ORC2 [Ceraceosorus bombacis]|uniref:ORC2 n=1 Tax=Ceraceosorus bombacis TaxID=401625 RepID=A0A0P1BE10_9BASI|nr:ORC2 [Ceraceosorus bombacis]